MDDAEMNSRLDTAIRINRVYQAAIVNEIPLALVQTFLIAARHEGSTVNEIKERVNGNLSTVSRHLLDLSENLRNGQPGYGLLNRVRHPTDFRSVVFTLSKKGKHVLSQLRDIMET